MGADLSLSGTIYPIETPTNPGQFDSRLYYEGQGVDCTVYAEKAQILKVHSAPIREGLTCLRERMEHVYEKIFGEQESGMMKAMILGQKGSLDKEMKELYQRNGIAHLLATSGLHISLVEWDCTDITEVDRKCLGIGYSGGASDHRLRMDGVGHHYQPFGLCLCVD